MLFGTMFVGSAKNAKADPIDDALFWYGNYGSDAIISEAATSVDPYHAFNYMGYNIGIGAHNREMYSLQSFNAVGWKIRVKKDYCSLLDHDFGWVDESTGQITKFFEFGAPDGTVTTVVAPNKRIHFRCMSGGRSYAWNSYSQGYPMIVSAVRNGQYYSHNYKAFQFYCEAQAPNFQQYPNTSPPGYASDYLDYRDHGYIVEFVATQCNDGIDNDGDGQIDRNDRGCLTNPQDPNSYDPSRDDEGYDNSNLPGAAINLQASDGTSQDYVQVTWSAGPRATSYQVYRSQYLGSLGDALGSPTSNLSYQDASAVPGVTYYYTVVSRNNFGNGPQSNTDSGFRASPPAVCQDSDGDGSPDADELADGTDKNDAGSFMLKLNSLPENTQPDPTQCVPSDSAAYTKYNSFLSQLNFLELVANGTAAVSNIKVTAYNLQGQAVNSTTVASLAPGQEFDIDVLALINNQKDTYGVVKINFDSRIAGATLLGRMTNYRPNPNATDYSFAFARELRNSTRGNTYATGNSFDPQGRGFLVPNWGEIVNVSDTTQRFVANLYDQAGRLLYTRQVSVPHFGEVDIQAGHEYGENVYLFEVIPLDGTAKYFMNVSRYSSNSYSGSEAPTYNYAFSLEGRAGTGASQYAPIENRTGGCYSQTNWDEVVNTREKTVNATVTFRSSDGTIVGQTSIPLAPKSQYHFNASALLPKGTDGSVKVDSSDQGALLTQSLVYFHDCSQNSLQTAFAAQGRIAGRDLMSGTMNSFLGMKNELFVASASTNTVSATLNITPYGSSPLPQQNITVGTNAQALNVLNAQGSGFPENSYGVVRLNTNRRPGVLAPFILRSRETADGRVDFIFPTMIQ